MLLKNSEVWSKPFCVAENIAISAVWPFFSVVFSVSWGGSLAPIPRRPQPSFEAVVEHTPQRRRVAGRKGS